MRTVIDIDKSLLERAQNRLGTTSMKETVNAALKAVTELDEREAKAREAFEFWSREGSPDLLDQDYMTQSWKRLE